MKLVWIIGGSGDIGAYSAIQFGQEGWDILLSARGEKRLQVTKDFLLGKGIKVSASVMDASSESSINENIREFPFSKIDVLIYNISPQEKESVGVLNGFLEHTVIGLYRILQGLEERGIAVKHVLVPTSSRGKSTGPCTLEYYVAKQALFSLLEYYRNEKALPATVVWLGKMGKSTWRWLTPEEIGEGIWRAAHDAQNEWLIGDQY